MENKNMVNVCRICLEEGASHPIFEANNEQDNIWTKLSNCLKEKVEDIEGLPRNLCGLCVETLETVCNFINKYNESSKILESGLLVIKDENYNRHCSENDHSEVEIEIDRIKTEPNDFDDIDDNECLAELIKPLHLKKLNSVSNKEIAKIKSNKELTVRKIKCQTKNKTNKIASSLLEGEFTWTGDKWCLKIEKGPGILKSRNVKRLKPPEKHVREVKLKIPKIKKPDPPKLCDVCGEVFKNQDKLSNHKRKVHFKKPAKCPECPRVCASDRDLSRHRKRRHEVVKNFICSICGHAFAFQGELTSHNNKVHNKHLHPPKVYACKICDKTYKCQKSVIVHERSMHTGQRPAECSICGSRFYHEDYLKEHMRLHTGETPFKCPICDRGYAQRGNMKSHLRIHRLAEIGPETLSKIKPSYLKLLKDFR
ncbi:unnamed protein product [Chilo suppressalis]|uniref:Uncharacterized protein n=1 Tax=Chilo suppressalis TaxID=168631 RepID=A0ABN8B2V7_CHISP|nr:hypothetical protein evm_004010 [Chilo suppressalis]CAH0400201.1 unnamed protein product [Chilo suppressalis]